MSLLEKNTVNEFYEAAKEPTLAGRWITIKDIQGLVTTKIGFSEENRPIYGVKLGTGKKKILIWTQMHGNESTGTKAVFDFINFIGLANEVSEQILSSCTLLIIPILNPDGAERYTRENAHQIDLNRDAVDRLATESKLLRAHLDDFQPDFCFNLHDQRTIFGVEGTKNPATISFLAPSEEVTRAITPGRKKTMNVIIAMNQLLQTIIPNHLGRYTDEFYPTATGDNFQKLGYSTILIESGHYYNDYDREKVREFTFYALLQGVYHISRVNDFIEYKAYFDIPNNDEMFLDIVKRGKNNVDIAYQYDEQIIDNEFVLVPQKVKKVDLKSKLFHNENDFVE
ncbi:MAG: zinc carboxypeptidase [Flavobacteriaceae bacterium]